jgi:hypothetical protein
VKNVVLVNFSHPITDAQRLQIEQLTGRKLDRIVEVAADFDEGEGIEPQVIALVGKADLSAQEWQTLPLAVNLPALSIAASLVVAELHGRTGYFPAVLRFRSVAGAVPRTFEVAELVNLQQVRDGARRRRL